MGHSTNAVASVVVAAMIVVALCSTPVSAASSSLRIMNCPITATSLSDCDMTGYAIRLAIFAAPGLIVGGLIILAAPLYLIGKYCCNCCGGRKQTPNFCCPSDELDARYSKGDILRPKIVILLALLVAVGAFVWGYVYGGKLEGGLLDFGDQITAVPVLLRQQLNAMNAALTVQLYDASKDTTSTVAFLQMSSYSNIMKEANSTLNQMDSMIGSNVGMVQNYVKQYSFIVFVFFAIPAAVLILGGVFAVCNIRRFGPMTLVWLAFILGFFVWISHAVFCLGSMVVADGCVEIHGVAYQQQNILPALVGCKNDMFSGFTANFNSLRTLQTQALCTALQPACYDGTSDPVAAANSGQVLMCPSPMDCTTVTFGQMTVWVKTAFYIHPNIVAKCGPSAALTNGQCCSTAANSNMCTLDLCQKDCTDTVSGQLSPTGKAMKQAYYSFLALRKISNTIDTLASQYANCDSLFTLLISPLDTPCKTITKALVSDRQASGLLGLCMIAGLFALSWGAKRFISLDEADKPQNEDKDAVQTLDS